MAESSNDLMTPTRQTLRLFGDAYSERTATITWCLNNPIGAGHADGDSQKRGVDLQTEVLAAAMSISLE